MLSKFRTLLGHTLIYGLGNYGIKIVGFLLIPLYTRYLDPTDYGVMALVSMYTQAMFICMNLGQSVSLFRFYYDHDDEESRQRVVAAALWIVLLFAVPLAAIPFLFPGTLSRWLLGDETLWFLMWIATGTVLAKVLLRMPFSIMRAKDQSKRYAVWSLARNALATILAVVLVAGFHMEATGVILSQFIGEVIMCALLTGMTFKMLRVGFHWKDIKEQLVFGLPLVPAGIAAFGMDLTNRWFLKHYYSVADVGIFSLGYRFGEILTFVVTAFQLSWPQFLFSHRKDANAPEIYAHMTNYYLASILFLWLGISAFAPELIRIMATPAYYEAAYLIPIISLAMALDGMAFMFNIGQLFAKKTIYRSVTVCTAAVVNLGLNFLLIPRYGMKGAAWATFAGFAVQAGVTLSLSQWLYPIKYRYDRLILATGVALGIYFVSLASPFDSLVLQLAVKALLVTLYPIILLGAGYFDPPDVTSGFAWLEKRLPPAAPLLRRIRSWLPTVSAAPAAAPADPGAVGSAGSTTPDA
jgi:O-antigen/teichoic acid export membrane protein